MPRTSRNSTGTPAPSARGMSLLERLQVAEQELLQLPADAPRVNLDKDAILALIQECRRALTAH